MFKLRVGTYNICHAGYADGDLSKIASVIREAGLDICGLQEVDRNTGRVGGVDQAKELAELSGLSHYRFVKSIDFDGGEYGTLILSRFPILEFERIPLSSASFEARSAGHAVLDVDGYKLDFFNTHTSFENEEIRAVQLKELAELLAKCNAYVLTGDFNTDHFPEFEVLHAHAMANSADNRIITFPGSQIAIDNIFVSSGLSLHTPSVLTEAYTDHYMLWAEVTAEEAAK